MASEYRRVPSPEVKAMRLRVRQTAPPSVVGVDYVILCILASFCWEADGTKIYPKLQTIGYRCRLTPRAVSRRLGNLRKLGAIEVTAPATQWKPTTYRFPFENYSHDEPSTLSDGEDDESEGDSHDELAPSHDELAPSHDEPSTICSDQLKNQAAAAEPVLSCAPKAEAIAAACSLDDVVTAFVAQREAEDAARGTVHTNPPGWRVIVARETKKLHGEAIDAYLAGNAHATATEVIDYVIREKKGSPVTQHNATQLDLALRRAASTALIGEPIDGLMQWLNEVNANPEIRTAAISEYRRIAEPF